MQKRKLFAAKYVGGDTIRLDSFFRDDKNSEDGRYTLNKIRKSEKCLNIFKDRSKLRKDYIPERLPHRDKDLKILVNSLKYLCEDSLPANTLIFGKTGTGKTATMLKAREIIKKELDENKSKILYCVAEESVLKTLRKLCIEEFGVEIPSRGISVSDARDTLFRLIGDRETVIIIDEIDKMITSKYHGDIMYFLTRKGNISIFGITNVVTVIERAKSHGFVDARVMSSWNPRKIVFKPYTMVQIKDILWYRIGEAFNEGVIDDGGVEYIASLAYRNGGDIRYAIDLLSTAADVAENNREKKIRFEHIETALDIIEDNFFKETILTLSDPEKCLLYTIADNRIMKVQEAYTEASKLLQEVYGSQIGFRRWADYRANLELYGYLELVRKGLQNRKGCQPYIIISSSIDPVKIKSVLEPEFENYKITL